MKNILEIKKLKKAYGEKQVVKEISFKVKEGEILGFLGPNGAGKSTTINMIATVVDSDSGEILFTDKPIKNKEKVFKTSLGVVPQELAFFSDLTAYDNVKFFCSLYGIGGEELKKSVKEALEFVGLWDRRKEYPDSFSGGMKRRLNIACAIAHKPRLLIMDEPTVGIDPQSRNNILEAIKKLNKLGITIIYTSHHMEEVEALCSRILIMDEGEIIEQGDKEYIKEKYRTLNKYNLEEIFLYLTGKELRD
ncbi:ABC transporter ATP-binding protein [Clostridium intestinale]|uniref:ABC transporter ATP-binding protein n=1 Tax=Clostridium intestinale TaxID=36845 RepID=A0A7D6ZF34_9CLOT|nr:ABC transporter ATP-binding protein [Clostridium intestinale]QLY78621.1 ABC transporter ATP-binding protein [Clostridium intestinale]